MLTAFFQSNELLISVEMKFYFHSNPKRLHKKIRTNSNKILFLDGGGSELFIRYVLVSFAFIF